MARQRLNLCGWQRLEEDRTECGWQQLDEDWTRVASNGLTKTELMQLPMVQRRLNSCGWQRLDEDWTHPVGNGSTKTEFIRLAAAQRQHPLDTSDITNFAGFTNFAGSDITHIDFIKLLVVSLDSTPESEVSRTASCGFFLYSCIQPLSSPKDCMLETVWRHLCLSHLFHSLTFGLLQQTAGVPSYQLKTLCSTGCSQSSTRQPDWPVECHTLHTSQPIYVMSYAGSNVHNALNTNAASIYSKHCTAWLQCI